MILVMNLIINNPTIYEICEVGYEYKLDTFINQKGDNAA